MCWVLKFWPQKTWNEDYLGDERYKVQLQRIVGLCLQRSLNTLSAIFSVRLNFLNNHCLWYSRNEFLVPHNCSSCGAPNSVTDFSAIDCCWSAGSCLVPVGVQCPISSSLGEFPRYWDWLWCLGLSSLLVSIAVPFAFHTRCFPFALICRWI